MDHEDVFVWFFKEAKEELERVRGQLNEARRALAACLESSSSRDGSPCKCGACELARSVLARTEPPPREGGCDPGKVPNCS